MQAFRFAAERSLCLTWRCRLGSVRARMLCSSSPELCRAGQAEPVSRVGSGRAGPDQTGASEQGQANRSQLDCARRRFKATAAAASISLCESDRAIKQAAGPAARTSKRQGRSTTTSGNNNLLCHSQRVARCCFRLAGWRLASARPAPLQLFSASWRHRELVRGAVPIPANRSARLCSRKRSSRGENERRPS